MIAAKDRGMPTCWICGDPTDHSGVPHALATGDGLTRQDIVEHIGDKEFRE